MLHQKERENGISITDYEKQQLLGMGVINLEKESAISIFIRVCESLAKQNFDFRKFQYSKTITSNNQKKQVYKSLKDIQQEYPEIDINKVIEETGVDLDYSMNTIKQANDEVRGASTISITEKEKEKLINMGVVVLQKESPISIFIRVCEALERQNFDFQSFSYTKNITTNSGEVERTNSGKIKRTNKTLKDLQQEYPEIDITKVLEETGVDLNYSIGQAKMNAISAINGTNNCIITNEEVEKLIRIGAINLENKLLKAKQKRNEAKTKNSQAKRLEQQVSQQLKKRGQTHDEQ